SAAADRRAQRAAQAPERDDAAQHAAAVEHHHRPERAQSVGVEQRAQRLVLADPPTAALVGLHQLAHEHGVPVFGRALVVLDGAPGALLAQHADEAAGGVDDGEPGPAVTQEELVERPLGRQLVRHAHRVGVHDVADAHVLELFGQRGLREQRARRAAHHQADEHEPERVQAERTQHAPQADSDQHDRERLSGARGDAGAGVAFAADAPHERAQDPAAVQRVGGDQVEEEHDRVHRHEEAERQQHRRDVRARAEQRRVDEAMRADEREADEHAQNDDRQRRERSGAGDLQLLARAAAFAAQQREPAERGDRDAGDVDPVAAGGERVAQLVHDDRREQQQRARDRGQVGGPVRAAERALERARQQEDHDEQHDEPAEVDADADAEDARELNRSGTPEHGGMVAQRTQAASQRSTIRPPDPTRIPMSDALTELRERLAEIADLSAAGGLLGWDQQTMMPERAAPQRAEQLGTLGRIVHERFTDDMVGRLLDAAEPQVAGEGAPLADAALVRVTRRDWEKARRVPAELAADLARAGALGHAAWVEARERSDFAAFLPFLRRNVELKLRYVDCFEG